MTIAVGDKLPDVKLMKATASGPQAVQTTDFFKGKRVALFSVPGAFTPTCSAKHLPGYVEKAAELRAQRHQPGHLGLGDRDLGAAEIGEADVRDDIILLHFGDCSHDGETPAGRSLRPCRMQGGAAHCCAALNSSPAYLANIKIALYDP